MISSEKFDAIVIERDGDKRNALIDELTEDEAKHMIKVILHTVRRDPAPNS